VAELVAEARAGAASGGDVRVHYLQGGSVTTAGSLLLTGLGTYNVEVEVAGDVLAEGSAATVRGGGIRAGGRIAVPEIGAPGGAPVRVTLEGARRGQRLATGVAHPGVEVVCGGSRTVVETRTLDFTVVCDEQMNIVTGGRQED